MTIPETTPDFCWPSMSVDGYAAFERATGATVIKVGGVWWRQVRPWFYRPLLPFKRYDLKQTTESISKIGAFQHGVEEGQLSNSHLNPVVFDQVADYDMNRLRKNVRSQIKKALKGDVVVSRIIDEREFAETAYPVYLSFYERTKYSFNTSRREKDGFARWAHSVFQSPEAVVLGSYSGSELLSFEISCLVEGALILKTIVNSEKGLRLGVPDLVLHYTRTILCGQPEVDLIYDSMLTHGAGINEFKILRGARVLALPAFLHIHPALEWLIKKSSSSAYGRLLGLGSAELLANGVAPTN
jgi:hypothetical protein